jgi:hypothetical protein
MNKEVIKKTYQHLLLKIIYIKLEDGCLLGDE